jgi:hypothetical protein
VSRADAGVRVYAGPASADSPAERAAPVVQELLLADV